jgi:hypothetical protein
MPRGVQVCSAPSSPPRSLPPTPIICLDWSGTMSLVTRRAILGTGLQSWLPHFCSGNVQRHFHWLGGMPPLRRGTKGYSTPITKGFSRRHNSSVPTRSETSAIDWPRYSIFVSNSTNPYFNLSLEDMCVVSITLSRYGF